jgi:putative ABC transport system permease protein
VLLGYGIAEAVSAFASWPVLFSTDAVLLSLIISAVTGIVFGTYPAWKAAQQNPIDVLRSE